ncbi:MAG: GTP cyclohydrolase MptA [Betaproteobacteria bacterium]|nr:GTP cyclohydrolase MptA [Betaproteobacteria bacterium]
MKLLHTAYLSLGSNCGNRQANILQALQHIRARAEVDRISSFYETTSAEIPEQFRYYIVACLIHTDLGPEELLSLLKRIAQRMCRQDNIENAPHPINIDILIYDDLILNNEQLFIPHPDLPPRPFALTPLSEIAPGLLHSVLGQTVENLLTKFPNQSMTKRSLRPCLSLDAQTKQPTVPLSLSRAGVKNQCRNIQLLQDGKPVLFSARMDLFVDLPPDQAGVHMSRFGDVVEDILRRMSPEPMPDIESLAEQISRGIVTVQGALRSEVHIRAHAPLQKTTPISNKTSEELYTLIGIASTAGKQTRRVIGVETEGMTVCPCAQDMVRDYSREMLREEGFTPDQVERILAAIPIASHNQRGRGTLLVGSDVHIRAENLVHLIEAAMSAETYALLKRPDELFVVNKGHRRPRFVEDVVREMLNSLVDIFPDLPDDAFVLAKQENLESIHKHNAFAERYGTLGEIRRELRGEGQRAAAHTSLDQWLKG